MTGSATHQSVLYFREDVNSNWFESNATRPTTDNDTLVDETAATTDDGTDPNLIVPGLMMGLVVVLSCLLCYMLLPFCLQWLRRKIPVTTAQVNRRYETVEGWLITKRVKAHCGVCEEVQRAGRLSSSSSRAANIQLTTSHDTAEMILHEEEDDEEEEEEEAHQCSICMESFQQNEIVSWSPSTECDHVFHHTCIKTWLLHHECCPYCRVCVLSVDNRNGDIARVSTQSTGTGRRSASLGLRRNKQQHWGKDQLQELATQRYQRLASTYFCLKEGLVTLDQPLGVLSSDMNKTTSATAKTDLTCGTMKQFLMSDVQPNEMMVLRTHPKSIRSTSDVVVTITSPTSQNVGMDTAFIDETAAGLEQQQQQHKDGVDRMAADAIIDIETTMKELPVISDDIADQSDTV